MTDLANFHFLRPEWLWLLLPLTGLLVVAIRRSNSGDWPAHVDRELLPYLLKSGNTSPGYKTLAIVTLAGLLAVIAIAGPAWRELPQPLFRNQSGIVLALDLSRSMNATDLTPDRISRARFKISDIIDAWPDGQIALLVYAADAFTVTPLTDDRSTLELQLPALDTTLMPAQGSNALSAITLANQLLKQAGLVKGNIWLLTDGLAEQDDIEELIDAAGNYPVSVLGIGTREGAPIATGNGFLKDSSGNIVLPKLEETPLRALAASSGGRYARLSGDGADIDHLLGGSGRAELASGDAQEDRRADLWQEEGPWLLLPLMLLAALAFRRGFLVVLLAVILMPPPAAAVEWPDNWQKQWKNLWQTPDQQAQQAFDRGDNPAAVEAFTDPAWQAAARYRQGDYEGAAQALSDRSDPDSLYNRGNAKAQMGDYQGALEDYDRVLTEQPDNEDARFNRELVQQQLEQQQKQQQDSGDQGESGDPQENPGESGEKSAPEDQSGSQSDDPSGDQSSPESDEADDQQEQNAEQAPENEGSDNDQDASGQTADEEPAQPDDSSPPAASQRAEEMDDETRQATEQWLRRIPDDPGGLLRRKFQYQYQRRNRGDNQQGGSW